MQVLSIVSHVLICCLMFREPNRGWDDPAKGHPSRFGRVLVLPMAPFHRNRIPAI